VTSLLTFTDIFCAIKWHGSLVCDLTNGGADKNNTIVPVVLWPDGYDLPLISGNSSLHAKL